MFVFLAFCFFRPPITRAGEKNTIRWEKKYMKVCVCVCVWLFCTRAAAALTSQVHTWLRSLVPVARQAVTPRFSLAVAQVLYHLATGYLEEIEDIGRLAFELLVPNETHSHTHAHTRTHEPHGSTPKAKKGCLYPCCPCPVVSLLVSGCQAASWLERPVSDVRMHLAGALTIADITGLLPAAPAGGFAPSSEVLVNV